MLKVRDKAKIKATKLKLSKGLRFGSRKAVRHGVKVKGGTVKKAKGRTLKVSAKGRTKVAEKAAKGALLRTRKLAGKTLRFKLVVRDARGKTTTLTLKAKPKP